MRIIIILRSKFIDNDYQSQVIFLTNFMLFFKKINIFQPLIASALLHLLLLLFIFNIFSTKSNLSNIVEIKPIAVISGSQFAKISSDFVKQTKGSTKISPNIAKGSEQSSFKNGVISNKKFQKSDNYDNSYLNIVANQIERNKSYISMFSAPSGVKSKVVFKIKLNESGELSSYKIVENSGYSFFNKAAVRILKLSAPFPAPPSEVAQNNAEITVPIVFDTISS